nr:hypothetical protein A152_06285 [Vibrio tasmaniensis 1F-187]
MSNMSNLQNMISNPRLNSYQSITGSSNASELIGAYLWNKDISSAIYPIFQCLEVSLRNSLNESIKAHFAMSDWFPYLLKIGGDKKYQSELSSNPNLDSTFFRNGISTPPRSGRTRWTSYHESMLKTAKNRLSKEGKALTANAIVAELMFGFWVSLFEQSYRSISPSNSIWPHIERDVFPNLSTTERDSNNIHQKLLSLKELRNRYSHHEPVWKHSSVSDKHTAISYLKQLIDDAVMIIQGISLERYNKLKSSGHIAHFDGMCTVTMLDSYICGDKHRRVDKRKLKRTISKMMKCKGNSPVTVNIENVPKMLIYLG